MKPSERIKEIHKIPDGSFYHTETSAILAYLDEEYEKERKIKNDKLVADAKRSAGL